MWDDDTSDYMEDPYFNPKDSTSTPSLDELDSYDCLSDNELLESELELFDLRQLDFDDTNCNSLPSINNDEFINVETEFFNVKRANAIISAFFKNKLKRQVRVTYCDLTKPYLAKLPKDNNFRKYLDISMNGNGKYKNKFYGFCRIKTFFEDVSAVIFYDDSILLIFTVTVR